MDSPKSDFRRHPRQRARLRVLAPLHKATRQLALRLDERLRGHALTAAEGHMLTYLACYGPAPIGELVRVFGARKSTMTSALDRLAARDLVAREPHPSDRRSTLIATTAAGDRAAATAADVAEQFERELLQRVRARDLDGFDRVLVAIETLTEIDVRET